ncbi:cytochrome P450 52A12 [Acephala macrosclerotiorum]|nr:cytochrome P450 52A12 [Acephala macrosclerotiorum]
MSHSAIYFLVAAIISFPLILWKVHSWVILHHQRQMLKKEHGCKEPSSYHNKDPIFGLDAVWRNYVGWKTNSLLPELTSRYQKYGNTYSLRMGGSRSLSTIEPENLKSILSTNFTSYSFGSKRNNALEPFLGASIFTLSGSDWQHSRAMIRPNLVKDQFVDAEMSTFEKHFGRLLSAIPRDGSEIDLQPLFFAFTLNTSIELLTGQDVHLDHEVSQMFDDAERLIGDQFLLSFIPFRRSRRQYLKACKLCHAWVDRYVLEAIKEHHSQTWKTFTEEDKASGEGKYSLLSELVKETYDVPRIRGELIGMLTAGRETTASALSSLWFTFAKRPDIVQRLRAEVAELGGEKPTFAQLKRMRYLQNTIQEALRLYPPLPANMRTAVEDTILPTGGGPDGISPIFVQKGQLIFYNIFAMHRRQDIYGVDAEIFRPERWEDTSLRPGWGYLPFNGGPRICLGQQFALTEIAYTTVRLLQEFQVMDSRDGSPWQEKWHINCAVKSGCRVSLS